MPTEVCWIALISYFFSRLMALLCKVIKKTSSPKPCYISLYIFGTFSSLEEKRHAVLVAIQDVDGFVKKQTKTNRREGDNVCTKIWSKKRQNKSFYPSWGHWTHPRKSCVGDQTSVSRSKIVDSSQLMAAKFLIYLFKVALCLYCVDMDLN